MMPEIAQNPDVKTNLRTFIGLDFIVCVRSARGILVATPVRKGSIKTIDSEEPISGTSRGIKLNAFVIVD
jgi:hypothetical protein